MNVTKCDLCKKEVDKRNEIYVSFPEYKTAEFCCKCAMPILKFLEKNKFMQKDNKIKKS